jgi:hypothetical protein
MKNPACREFSKLFVVVPTPLYHYVEVFIEESIHYKDLIVLVPSIDLNPEPYYYYQKRVDAFSYKDITDDESLPHKQTCEPLPHQDIE